MVMVLATAQMRMLQSEKQAHRAQLAVEHAEGQSTTSTPEKKMEKAAVSVKDPTRR
jgi:hypothetical protein